MPQLLSLMMQYFMLDMLIDTDPTEMFTCVRGLCLVAVAIHTELKIPTR